MKGIAITSIGIEDAAVSELSDFGASSIVSHKGAVLFDVKKIEDLAHLAYTCQSADRILLHLCDFSFSNIQSELKGKIASMDFPAPLISPKMTFRVTCQRRGEHDFTSASLEPLIGDEVFSCLKERGVSLEVDLHHPDLIFYLSIVDDKAVFGIDFTGFDASKRDYKIFLTPVSIKGTLAFGLLKYAGYEKKHELLDPFVNDGAIIIEAALFSSNKPVHFYRKDKFGFLKLKPFKDVDPSDLFASLDKRIKKEKVAVTGYDAAFQYVDYGKKNAKIAGVEKIIYLSRVESEWLDIKHEKKTVDRIVTKIPEPSRKLLSKDIEKLQGELFYQAEYILKDNGRVGLICRDLSSLEKHYSKYGFIVEKQKDVFMGEQKMVMAVLVKGEKLVSN